MAAITMTLESMAYGGEAVGRHEDRAVFVPLGIPGETVRVQIVEERKRYAVGRLLEVLKPAPERVTPPCRYFGACGGCQWQHIDYPAQLRFKGEIVLSQLQRIGKQPNPLVRPMIGMDEPWGYRNHVQLAMDRAGRVGYQALRSHDVVPVEECWITHALLDELWGALDIELDLRGVALRAGIATGEQMVALLGHEPEAPELELDLPISCLYEGPEGEVVVLAGESYYHEQLGGRTFRVSGPSFFQVNTAQAERMVEVVQRYLKIKPGERVIDAYCGVGVLALTMAAQGAQVLGVEESAWAIEDAVANSTDADDVEWIEGAVEEVLPGLEVTCDAVVLDPPRAGCAPAVLDAVAACEPSRIVYVSCDPATLARDIARLTPLGYTLMEVQPIDMFPQTFHVESVALIERKL